MEPINDITKATTEASPLDDYRVLLAANLVEHAEAISALRTDIDAIADRLDRLDRNPLPEIAIETITAAIEEITTGGDFRCQ